MKFFLIIILSLSTLAAHLPASSAAAKVVRMISSDWPPYSGSDLPEQGATIKVVRAAFAKMGYHLIVEHHPWERAISISRHNPEYIGILPIAYSKKREKTCIFSQPVGANMPTLAYHRDDPVEWDKLTDLKGIPIGTVRGYLNSVEFDRLAAENILTVRPVATDNINLRKLAAHRLRLAVVDLHVLHYLLETDPDLVEERKKDKKALPLLIPSKIIEKSDLFICFSRSRKGKRMNALFSKGLSKIDPEKIFSRYMNDLKTALDQDRLISGPGKP